MAKLTVEYRCGHDLEEVRFGGKYQEQLDYTKDHRDCPACDKARKIHERETANAGLREALTDLPLVTLEGSDKQVRWANDIRTKVLTAVREMRPKVPGEQQEKLEKLIEILAQKPSAKWWIDTRDIYALKLAWQVAKAEGLIS